MNLLSSSFLLNDLEDEVSSEEKEKLPVDVKPVIGKKEYNKMTVAEQFEYKRLKKIEKQNKAILTSQHSQTHEWTPEGEIIGNVYRPMAGNCKRCGNHYQLFKLNPVPCPNQKK